MVNANMGWVVGSYILKTTDGGVTWNSQFSPSNTLYSVRFADAHTGVAVGTYGNTYTTTDGGTNWTAHPNNIGNLRSLCGINTSTAWVLGDNGTIYRTTDGGSTWTRQLTNTNYNQLNAVQFVDANNGWAVGDNGTILRTTSGGTVTSVWENRSHEIPRDFLLYQNYPNPFNPSTTIYYQLPQAAHITLKVYNTLGAEVATLVSEFQNAGFYQVRWNAKAPSGIYFYRLQAGSYVQTRKLILLR